MNGSTKTKKSMVNMGRDWEGEKRQEYDRVSLSHHNNFSDASQFSPPVAYSTDNGLAY